MKRVAAFLTCLAAVFSLVGSEVAFASCNQIPSADMLRVNAGGASSVGGGFKKDLKELTWGGVLPFKGALGRTSRSLVVPSAGMGILVAPDFTCVDGDAGEGPRNVAARDELVSAIFYYRRNEFGKPIHIFARVFADNDEYCELVDDGLPVHTGGAGSVNQPKFSVLGGCNRSKWKLRKTRERNGAVEYQIALPIVSDDINPERDVAPDVRVAVLRSPAVDELSTLVRDLAAAEKCAGNCRQPGALKNAVVCIDDLYQTDAIDSGVATAFSLDQVACAIEIPQSGISCNANDFKDLCTSVDVPGFANCTSADQAKNEISYWRSSCGGIHFPFTWKAIREKPNQPNKKLNRVLAGVTGAGRKKSTGGTSGRMYVPGPEFFGSTSCVSHCVDPPCTNAGDWRVPELELWTEGIAANNFGLTGVVDKDASVLHVFPRQKSALQCGDVANPQGCTKVESYQGKRQVICACTDREPVGCTCDDSLPGRFFECSPPAGYSGPYEYSGLPCTRHAHCPFGGFCSASPTCVKSKKAVWKKNAAVSGMTCQNDSDCTGQNEVCGYRLFDFASRLNSGSKDIGTLRRKIKGSGNTVDRRGYCSNEPDEKCNKDSKCASLPSCGGGTCECTGFFTEAGGKP